MRDTKISPLEDKNLLKNNKGTNRAESVKLSDMQEFQKALESSKGLFGERNEREFAELNDALVEKYQQKPNDMTDGELAALYVLSYADTRYSYEDPDYEHEDYDHNGYPVDTAPSISMGSGKDLGLADGIKVKYPALLSSYLGQLSGDVVEVIEEFEGIMSFDLDESIQQVLFSGINFDKDDQDFQEIISDISNSLTKPDLLFKSEELNSADFSDFFSGKEGQNATALRFKVNGIINEKKKSYFGFFSNDKVITNLITIVSNETKLTEKICFLFVLNQLHLVTKTGEGWLGYDKNSAAKILKQWQTFNLGLSESKGVASNDDSPSGAVGSFQDLLLTGQLLGCAVNGQETGSDLSRSRSGPSSSS